VDAGRKPPNRIDERGATPRGPVSVRPATPDDAPAIRDVGMSAWRATYSEILGPDMVERFLAVAYSPDRVALRVERDDLFVGSVAGGDPSGVDGFIETLVEDGHAHIVAFYTRPDTRGMGLGSALLERVIGLYPGLDISADVLIGNTLGEPFYVARGFEPGDLLDEEFGDDVIRERRWWLRADRA
jgi:GNAT superfamily N-acetyltransferase